MKINLIPYNESKKEEVCKLYFENDFYFKTFMPDYLSESEILSSVNDAILIEINGEVAGLVECGEVMEAAGHYGIDFRVSKEFNIEETGTILSAIIQAYTVKVKVNKLAVKAYEKDEKYLSIFNECGFEVEGTLPNLVTINGENNGEVRLHKTFNSHREDKKNQLEESTINRFNSREDQYAGRL
ncbi:hypothetical protein [Rossellomorea aquimaris]|uniref:N-acetyltransferase domain-containing protein n=1 Tax=Rossellomorea aquimaris TaxID=189382 RepID=A0A1J6VZN8_9BACI|nr:hypothetical protein [Rossellomorea aquimaris]OIU69820.1 hypothetical protein BHE18_02615 [Rossellomorea aquimaris]